MRRRFIPVLPPIRNTRRQNRVAHELPRADPAQLATCRALALRRLCGSTRRVRNLPGMTRAFRAFTFMQLLCAMGTACSHAPIPGLASPISAEPDSALRVACEVTISREAAAGRRVYRESEVEQKADMILENRWPHFPNPPQPPTTVEVEFVIDSSGRADMETLRPVLPAPADFFQSVADYLSKAKFHAARVAGHPVRMCVRQTFQFQPVYGPNGTR